MNMVFEKDPIERRFIIFISVGIVSAIVDVCVMKFSQLIGFHFVLAVSIGFLAGFIVNYILHLKVTFQSIGSIMILRRFVLVVALNYVLTVICVSISEKYLNSVLEGKLFSLPLVALNGYLLSKFWVFKS